jgi:hypothetical protein
MTEYQIIWQKAGHSNRQVIVGLGSYFCCKFGPVATYGIPKREQRKRKIVLGNLLANETTKPTNRLR